MVSMQEELSELGGQTDGIGVVSGGQVGNLLLQGKFHRISSSAPEMVVLGAGHGVGDLVFHIQFVGPGLRFFHIF